MFLECRDDRDYRDYKRDSGHRHSSKDYKRDRYHDHHGSHHNRYLSSSPYGVIRNPRDENNSYGSRYDDYRHSSSQRNSSSSHYTNYKYHENSLSSESSYGGSPYSTPPPAPPPGPPPAPPVNKYSTPNNFIDRNTSRTSDPRMSNMSKNQSKSNNIAEEKKQNFRLLIDPTIKKGHMKIIRYDGILAGVSINYCFVCAAVLKSTTMK